MPGFLGEADIPEFLADIARADGAVAVTLGATTVTGLFDRAAVQFFDGEMATLIAEGEAVHIQTGSLPGLAPAAAITVDGTDYKVLRVLSYGDGAMQRVALTSA